jgi:hypothetical protein
MKKILTILTAVLALSTAANARDLTDAERASCLEIARGGSGPGSRTDCFERLTRKANKEVGLPKEIVREWCSVIDIDDKTFVYVRDENSNAHETPCLKIQPNGDMSGENYACKAGKISVDSRGKYRQYSVSLRCEAEGGTPPWRVSYTMFSNANKDLVLSNTTK